MSSAGIPRRKAPPKKSKKGLVIGIIIASSVVVITVIVVVVILLLRRNRTTTVTPPRTTPPTPTPPAPEEPECALDADCPSGEVCNGDNGTCVECLSDLNCPAGAPTCDVATNTCIPLECQTGSDCTAPEAPFCIDNECLQCAASADCSGNTIYSSVNKNFCDTGNECVECLLDADCGVGTCQSGVCCNLTPPTIATVSQVGNNDFDLSVAGGYTTVQGIQPGDQIITSIYDEGGTLIYEQAPRAADGFYSMTRSEIGFPLLGRAANDFVATNQPFQFKIGIEFLRACGTTASSTLFTYIPGLSSPPNTTPFFTFTSNVFSTSNSGNTLTFTYEILNGTPWSNDVKLGFIAKKAIFGPAQFLVGDFGTYDEIRRNLSSTLVFDNTFFNTKRYSSTTTLPTVFGETWYFYFFLEGTATNGSTVSPYLYENYTIQ